VLYAGDLVVDRTRGQTYRNDQPLNLTPTEFRLLVYLAQNAGQALTRAHILDSVWGYDSDVESEKIVNVHIRRLREKVEIDPNRPVLVLTVPGIGYRLAR
jgi:two-component system response regulator MtrA